MACTNCTPTTNPIIVPMTVAPCNNCAPVKLCKLKTSTDCIIYNYGDTTTPSGLTTLNFPNGSNLTSILNKIDLTLSQTYQPIILDSFRQLANITGTSVSLQTLLNSIQQVLSTSSSNDRFVKVNSSDSNSGYLTDKLSIGSCLIKTNVIESGITKVKLELDFACVLDKISTTPSLKTKFAQLVASTIATTGSNSSPCSGQPTTAIWVSTNATRCNGTIQEAEEKDTNLCSATYNSTRWKATGNTTICKCAGLSTTPVWSDTGQTRCTITTLEKQQKDLNSCSSSYNTTKWITYQLNSPTCAVSCNTYRVSNDTNASMYVNFKDCSNTNVGFSLNALQSTNICAKQGSITAVGGLTITLLATNCTSNVPTGDIGSTSIPLPSPVQTPSPTLTPVSPAPTPTPTPVSPVSPISPVTPISPAPVPTPVSPVSPVSPSPTPTPVNETWYPAGQFITANTNPAPSWIQNLRYTYNEVNASLTIQGNLNPNTAPVEMKIQPNEGQTMTLANNDNPNLSPNVFYPYGTISIDGFDADWSFNKGQAGNKTGIERKSVIITFRNTSDSSQTFSITFTPVVGTNITLY